MEPSAVEVNVKTKPVIFSWAKFENNRWQWILDDGTFPYLIV
jgi:hypothetical protein